MVISERSRNKIHNSLAKNIGQEEADDLMEYLPPVGWADVATKHDLSELEKRLDSRFDAKLESKLRSQFMALAGLNVTTAGVVIAAIKL